MSAEIVIFEKPNYKGKHHHIYSKDNDLTISLAKKTPLSMVIKSGKWKFYAKKNFKEPYKDEQGKEIILPPDLYPNISEEGITDKIFSIELAEAFTPEEEINEMILFAGLYFTGFHHHIFGKKRGDGDNNLADTVFITMPIIGTITMNDTTQSVIVISGIWGLNEHTSFEGEEYNRLGPGMYSSVSGFNITKNRVSSVYFYSSFSGLNLNEVILFDGANFQGKHSHVYSNDADLRRSFMHNQTSSLVVIKGNWKFYGTPGFGGTEYFEDQSLGPAMYGKKELDKLGLEDNVISSARLAVEED